MSSDGSSHAATRQASPHSKHFQDAMGNLGVVTVSQIKASLYIAVFKFAVHALFSAVFESFKAMQLDISCSNSLRQVFLVNHTLLCST